MARFKTIREEKELTSEQKELDQYVGMGSFDDDSDPYRELEKVSPYIGEALVAFSNLEHSLELHIAGLQSDRSDEPGMFVIRFLKDNRLKIDYFIEIARRHIIYSDLIKDKDRPKLLHELKELTKRLSSAAEIRNIVAHSKWNTITRKCMVVNSVKLNKSSGRVEVRLYKLGPRALGQIIRGFNTTNDELRSFGEKISIR